MARTPTMVLSTTLMIAPSGWALPAAPNSTWGKFLLPLASAWSDLQANAEQLGPEIDPRSSTILLSAWQQLLGPDPCGRDLSADTLFEQQQIIYQRLTARGGQSIGYFLSLATSVGETASIQEGTWFRFGQKRFGVGCFSAAGNQFNWRVTLEAGEVVQRRFGTGRFAYPFGSFRTSLAQCPITHACPAHTNVSFGYVSSGNTIELEDLSGGIALEDNSGIIIQES